MPAHIETADILEIFCDGSVTNAIMTGPFESHLGTEHVGRGMVVAPALDVGLIAQTRDVLSPRGKVSSVAVERFSIRLAIELARARRIDGYRIFNDCQSAIGNDPGGRVSWRSREEMHLPNRFFEQVLGRAGYLRRSSAKVGRRRTVEAHQVEAFELFCAARREFALSASPLWQRVLANATKYPRK